MFAYVFCNTQLIFILPETCGSDEMGGRLGDGEGVDESKETSRLLAGVTVGLVVPFTERGHTRGKTRLQKEEAC